MMDQIHTPLDIVSSAAMEEARDIMKGVHVLQGDFALSAEERRDLANRIRAAEVAADVEEAISKPVVKEEDPDEETMNAPITEWRCHLTDRDKARKVMESFSEAGLDALPLVSAPGVRKNHLIAMSGGRPLMFIHLKTGRIGTLEADE